MLAVGLALELPVMAHEAHDGVVRFRPRIGEEDVLEALRHDGRDLRRDQHPRVEPGDDRLGGRTLEFERRPSPC